MKEKFADIQVCAFEPSPQIFPILEANARKYGGSVSLYNCGMADQAGTARFIYYPRYSIMSGLHAGGDEDRQMLRQGIRSRLQEQAVDASDIPEASLDRMVKVALGDRQEHVCQLRTVSEVIEEKSLPALGLLKIDLLKPIIVGFNATH